MFPEEVSTCIRVEIKKLKKNIMDFEELFENKHKRPHHHNQHAGFNSNSDHNQHSDYPRYSDNQAYIDQSEFSANNTRQNQGYHSKKHTDQNQWLRILETLRNNKKLRRLTLIAGFIILVIIILLMLAFLPLIKSLIQYLMDNGLKGLMDWIAGIIEKIGNVSGK
jgi:hypothetical protein